MSVSNEQAAENENEPQEAEEPVGTESVPLDTSKPQESSPERVVVGVTSEASNPSVEKVSAVAVKDPRRFSARELVLAIVAIIALIAAIAGFALYNSERVPVNVAAKVNNTYLAEDSVAHWIDQYRAAYSLTEDADFAVSLLSQGLNVSTFRQNAINQLALSILVDERAAELGITPTDEQAQEQVDVTKASVSFGDEGVWADTLEMYGLTEEGLLGQYKTNLAQQAIFEADVAHREATDDETLSYLQTYLAGTTQKHAYRITFTGDDASERAQACFDALSAAQADGGVTVAAFSEFAKEYSDEEGVDETAGSYAWSGSAMGAEEKEFLENIEVNAFSNPESIESDGSFVILYCDDSYTFPAAEEMTALPTDVPSELMAEVRDAASDALWDEDCSAYLSELLAAAKITYYPIPDGATYNVDMALATS